VTKNDVVVGFDGTEDGERALAYGVGLASREGARLRLVHVPHQSAAYAPIMPYLPEPQMLAMGEEILSEARKLAVDAGFDPAGVDTVLSVEPRTPALLHESKKASNVVLGTRASALQHFFTGSTTLSVAARATAPVHCVPRDWSPDQEPRGVLVAGLDGTPADVDVLEAAFHEAERREAQLRLVHAWRPVSPYDAAIMRRTDAREWARAAGDAITQRVDAVAGRHPATDWKLELDYERVAVALHESAVEADLLVLGRHSHVAPFVLAIGSNTRTLLRTATGPVVVVPIRTHEKDS
jgi:nucleotide-binding universal stress UspA family protein